MSPATDMPVKLESLPHGGHQITIDGKPFLMRAGEVQNSTFSCPRFTQGIWQRLVDGNINTVLGAVGWEDIEPEEGHFIFDDLDEVINQARQHNLRLVLLWFGSHKNGHMTYAPPWVKSNPTRFPRTVTLDVETKRPKVNGYLSVLSRETASADARAFAALMAHLKVVDGAQGQGTVIMVQVNNEGGVLADTRDRNEAAEKAFNSPVPQSFLDTLCDVKDTLNSHIREAFPVLVNGEIDNSSNRPNRKTWGELFGYSIHTDELFMAYYYALFTETICVAGRAQYDLPLYTNAALRSTSRAIIDNTGGGSKPGIYPSGGPVETVIDVYQLFAPHLDFVSPDIYFADYDTMCREYTHRGRPLFIPEQRRDEPGALRMWLAIGQYGGLGAAPFGIDSITAEESVYTRHYALVKQVEQHIHSARQDGRQVTSFFFDAIGLDGKDTAKPLQVILGDYELTIKRQGVHGRPASGYGMIIQQPHSTDTYLLIGEGYTVAFRSRRCESVFTGLMHVHEKEVVDLSTGELRTGRKFNGDETGCGQVAIMPSENPDAGWYPIATYIPSRTRIAECRVYSI